MTAIMDTFTHNISIALYRYMCQNIVGTEDHVKRIRVMNAASDNMASSKLFTSITSGSFGEGLQMRGSDLDIMYVYHHVEVCEFVNFRLNPDKKNIFSMETDDVKPGFARLQLRFLRHHEIFKQCEENNGKHYLSSALFKQWRVTPSLRTIHGPCLTDKYEQIDKADCIHCKTWVSPAVQWTTRSSNSWPSHGVKQSILKHGVLFVPVGVKGSPHEHLEWRVSFSFGEKLLINTFTHTQLLCYALLKITLKDVINTSAGCKDLLCSYFLKTTIFWISEELPQSVWKPDNLIHCFMRCFNRLIYCIEHSMCLHYFIPEYNMFENKIDGCSRDILLEKMNTLHSYGWRCILFSDQISKVDISMWNVSSEPLTLYVNEVENIIQSIVISAVAFTLPVVHMKKFNESIKQIVHCQQSSIKDVYKYYLSKRCSGIAQCILLDKTLSTCNNKHRYKQYKSCLSFLLINVYHDAVSGWLILASLFYKTKQYSKALHIIMYSISKCTHEKIYDDVTLSDVHYQVLKLQTLQKKSFVCLLKIMLVDFIQFEFGSTLLPDELQLKSITLEIFRSTAFAYFLCFLCHYHLNNAEQCQDSLHSLQLNIDEDYLMTDRHRGPSYTLLGVVLQLLGDKESARLAFIQSEELPPYQLFNSAAMRLLLMN